jgi:hypothetical protein
LESLVESDDGDESGSDDSDEPSEEEIMDKYDMITRMSKLQRALHGNITLNIEKCSFADVFVRSPLILLIPCSL